MIAHALEVRGLTVRYGEVEAIHRFDLTVSLGETVALLGPSGSGKTTFLYAVAGFIEVDEGEISIGGRQAQYRGRRLPPEDRDVGFVFQNYALWPHLNAQDTVAFPMRRRGLSAREARQEARALLDSMGIASLAQRRPAELSGGEQQRVGLARALARRASLYLFDEPTAHLDASLRTVIQNEITERRRETGAAAVYATHDAAEALAGADRLVLLRDGRPVQVGQPDRVYEKPVDVWAARLTGPASIITLDVIEKGDRVLGAIAGSSVRLELDSSRPVTGKSARVLVRPGWARLGGDLSGVIRRLWYRGAHTDYELETPAGEVEVRMPGSPRAGPGQASGWSLDRGWVLPHESGGGFNREPSRDRDGQDAGL